MEIVRQVHTVAGVRGASVFLLVDDAALSVIDTGLPGSGAKILDYICRLGRRPEELRYIILTHNHPDHAGSAAELRGLTGAKVVCHPADAKADAGGHLTVMPRILGQHHGVTDQLRWLWPRMSAPVDMAVTGGDLLPILGGLRIIHVPGHTPGSICLHLEEQGVLFVGDLIINNGSRLSRPLSYPGANLDEYEESLGRVAALGFEVCCFAHGEPLTKGAAMQVRELALHRSQSPLWWRVARNSTALVRFMARLMRPAD